MQAASLSLEKSGLTVGDEIIENKPEGRLRQLMGEELRTIFDDAMARGDLIFKSTKEQIMTSPHFQNQPQPTDEEIRGILSRNDCNNSTASASGDYSPCKSRERGSRVCH